MFSGTTLSGCYNHSTAGVYYWTAGQRIDPSRGSTFVWRVTSTNTYSDTLSAMTYTNWASGQPSSGSQACMHLWYGNSYTWNDQQCRFTFCSVCEIDM